MENKWRALRYGLDGKLIDFGKQIEVPVRDLIYEYLQFVDDVVDELGSRKEINYIHRILENGTGADRQLRIFQETGDLTKVMDYIVYETEAGLSTETGRGDSVMSTGLNGTTFDPELRPGAHNAVFVCLKSSAIGEGDADHRSRLRGDRGEHGFGIECLRLHVPHVCSGRSCAAASDGDAGGDSGRYGIEPGQHFCGSRAGQRTENAHADDAT